MTRGEGSDGRSARRDLARWAACFLAVLSLHGGMALGLLAHSAEDEAAGMPTAIPIELAALPVAPSAEPMAEAVPGPEQTQSEASPAEAADAEPPRAVPETAPPDPPPPEPVTSAEAKPEEPPPVAEPVPVPDLKPAPKPEIALAAPPEKQKIEPEKPKPREARKPEKPREKTPERDKRREEAKERQERLEEEKRREAKEAQRRRQASRVAAASATTAPASARSAAARAAAPMGNAGTSSSLPEWKVRLAAHLQRNKRYPSEAQASGQEGVATLQFTVDRNGRVTSSRLVRSSGVPALDAETLALIRRAQPLPPPPPDVPGAQFSFSVPFRYSMR